MPSGFTLVEIIMVVVIMGSISLMIATAYPNARAEQKLTLAEQTLQAALRAAQQTAINEERDPACITQALALGNDQKRCSDIGIVLEPTQHNIIVFADIFEPDRDNYDSANDVFLSQIPFPDGVAVLSSASQTTLIFQGVAPTIGLFTSACGAAPSPCEVINSIVVTLSIGDARRELDVGSYGQVERHK
jgi:prepilin-type N-terminal cleavage/methylation domain-containing protein